jgi:hypothetical protein
MIGPLASFALSSRSFAAVATNTVVAMARPRTAIRRIASNPRKYSDFMLLDGKIRKKNIEGKKWS